MFGKTHSTKTAEVEKKWLVIDAKDLVVGRLASINFLRKPAPLDLIGKARLIKLGKRLAVGEVALYSDGESEMVAHATGTYSIPKRGQAVPP